MNTPPTEKELKQIEKRLLKACKKYGYPDFFATDFIKYQNKKNWIFNGKPIKGVTPLFRAWAKVKKQKFIDFGGWMGANNEDWDLTPAVFLGYYKVSNPQNKVYIESLILKVNNGENLTALEQIHAQTMRIIDCIENLKNEEPDHENNNPIRLKCIQCGMLKFSYEKEKKKFCPKCGKYTLFVKNED